MKNEKWFYQIQRNLADKLYSEYHNITTQFQDVTPDHVFELKYCYPGNEQIPDILLVCMTKSTGRFSIYKCIEK